MPKKNEVALIDSTIYDLKVMIEDSVKFQAKVSPIYKKLVDRILDMFNKDEELSNWEPKELIKLLELSNKAQLAPVEQLTKLVQSVTALYGTSELQDRVDRISQVVDELNKKKKDYIESQDEEEAQQWEKEDIKEVKDL